ncbi:MAG: GGDEF domain-containing protein [Candidatus Saganbacteria bacterium]|nr:GGDEF domain-containing protein [Candidatus Saganbacteria bacterium]
MSVRAKIPPYVLSRGGYKGPNARALQRYTGIIRARGKREIRALKQKMQLVETFRVVEQQIRDKLSGAATITQVLGASREVMEGLGIGGVAIYRYSNESGNMWAMEREALGGKSRYNEPNQLLPGEKSHFIMSGLSRGYNQDSASDMLLVDRLNDLKNMSLADREQAERDFEADLRRYFGDDYRQVSADQLQNLKQALRYNLYVRYPGVRAYDMIILANNHIENAERIKRRLPPRSLFSDNKAQEMIFDVLRSLQRPITEELQKAENSRINALRIIRDAAIDKLHRALSETDALEEMFKVALDNLPSVYMRNGETYVARSSIMLLDEPRNVLRVVDQRGLASKTAKRECETGKGIAGHVFVSGQPLLVENAEADQVFQSMPERNKVTRGSFMCVPIRFKDRTYGVMNVRSEFIKAFTEADLKHLIRIADFLAYKMREVNLIRELEHAANYDYLTGLPLRRFLISRMEEMMERAKNERLPFTYLLIDLDHFKRVNDRYGHVAGDIVLKGAAQVISNWLEANQEQMEDGIAGRWGGEEWVVGMLGINERDGEALANGLRSAFEAKSYSGPEFWHEDVNVTASIGLSVFPFSGHDLDSLFSQADEAIYTAKNNRNQVVVFSPRSSS